MTHLTPIQQRLRITFGKSGALKYTSNLDVAKIWERVLRRADLPILYTQGFNTRPRIQLAMALPLGITSECELLDVALREEIEFDETKLIEQLLAVSPQGLTISKIEQVDPHASAMQNLIESAEYQVHFVDVVDADELQAKVNEILATDRIIMTQQGKRRKTVYDMRPLIFDLKVDEDNDLLMHLAVGERGNLRPNILLEYMKLQNYHHTIHRFALHEEVYRPMKRQS